VPGDLRDEVMTYLRERELVTNVYRERQLSVRLEGSKAVDAVCYVVDRRHDQYAGALSPEDAVRQVRGAVGKSGPNEDYVRNTVSHLEGLGIRDHWLESVARALGAG
jgi:cation transport protein ChaC